MANKKWNMDYIWQAYRYADAGLNDQMICESLKVGVNQFRVWRKRYPALERAIKEARRANAQRKDFDLTKFIYGKLPEELQEYWDYINMDEPVPGKNLSELSVEAKQALYLHAWYESDFNMSEACRKIGIHRNVVQDWRQSGAFRDLTDQMITIRKDFVESKVMQFIREGNAYAAVQVNKALNKDRGYNEKVDVSVNGHVTVDVNVFAIDDLKLPITTRRQILDAIRKHKDEQLKGSPLNEAGLLRN